MRGAALLLVLVAAVALAPRLSEAAAPVPAVLQLEPGATALSEAPVQLARCGPRCRAERRAWRRYHHRPHRPRPPLYRPRPHYSHHHHHYHRRRGDAAAAAIIGGVIGLGIGAAIANSRPEFRGDDRAPRFDSRARER